MEKMLALFLLLQLLSVEAQQADTSSYARTGDCQEEKTCVYNYNTEQHFSHNNESNDISISLVVEISCHSVGEFNGTSATQFCMKLSNLQLRGSMLKDEGLQHQQSALADMLEGWFCFVQSEDGKVVAVHHTTGENEFAVNLKKSIAAAFQANFKGTKEEGELDPQSNHISHYSYEEAPEGNQKMHRHVDINDIIDLSTGSKKKDLELTKDEDIEYRSGKLYYSAGTTEVKVKEKKKELRDKSGKSLSEALSGYGSYSLELDRCQAKTVRSTIHQRRSLNKRMNVDMIEEDLVANFNETLQAQKTMQEIRENLPSITDALRYLHSKPSDLKLYNTLKELLILEYEYGALDMYTPAIEDLLDYLTESEVEYSPAVNDVEMCEIIYSLLSAEGSLRSQMILLEALKRTMAEGGQRVLIHVSMIRNPHMEFITELEEILDDESLRTTKLLLEFGVLASKGQPEVEQEVTRYLLNLETIISVTSNEFITLLMAMGNTGSEYVLPSILNYTEFSLENVQLSSIRACLKFSHLLQVLDNLNAVLETGPNEAVVTMIVHTLVKGHQYAEDMEVDTNAIANHPILLSMVVAVQNFNNTELLSVVYAYLQEVGGEEVLAFLAALHNHIARRESDWDNSHSDYNLVASLASRQSDVQTYPIHKAYIRAITIGNSDANLKAAGGLFVGFSNDFQRFKGFAKLYAECNLLSRKRTLVDIEVLYKKTVAEILSEVLAEIGGSVLVTGYGRYSYEENLYKNHYNLFSFTYSVYVYAGNLKLGIDVYLETSGSLKCGLTVDTFSDELLDSSVSVVPTVTFSAVGSVSFSFVVAKVGISVSGSIGYKLEPRFSGKVCSYYNYQACVGLYAYKPDSSIEVYAWYRLKEVKFCKGPWWIKYPCGFEWGREHRVDSLSWIWSSEGRPRSPIYEQCRPENSTCSASPLG